jgi:hypothetical protein
MINILKNKKKIKRIKKIKKTKKIKRKKKKQIKGKKDLDLDQEIIKRKKDMILVLQDLSHHQSRLV